MIQFLRSIDREELLYSALLIFSLAFTSAAGLYGRSPHLGTRSVLHRTYGSAARLIRRTAAVRRHRSTLERTS